ncbi:MAG: alpha-amylase, partial [Tidjanibacter sp.]|nr:alpha-amylase [Tidjanibacter sp.]
MKKLFALVALVATLMGCCGNHCESTSTFDKFNSVVYELNVRQATEEGTFAAAEEYLPELKAMGVDIVWLMPISPIGVDGRKGTLGSYYSIIDYKAINPEFGTMEDFDHFLATAHDLGLKVIIDWV